MIKLVFCVRRLPHLIDLSRSPLWLAEEHEVI